MEPRHRHRHVRDLLATGSLTLLLAFSSAGSAQAGNGHPATLKLDPTSGSAGGRVIVVVSAFGQCPPIESPSPSPSPSGADQPAAARAPKAAVGGRVQVIWDDEVVAETTDTGKDIARAEFDVPPDASIGRHTVAARCPSARWRTDAVPFEVTGTEEEPIRVPKVIGMDRDEAEKTLIAAELSVGEVSGQGGKVTKQNPGFGSTAAAGDPVWLEFGAVVRPPVTVVVPKLVGRSLSRARALLRDRRLVLGAKTGEGKIVREQHPVAGSRVPVGSAVGVTVQRGVDAPLMSRVPDVVGSNVRAARSALAVVKLKLAGEPPDDRAVATQRPAAGTLVAAGSVVTVTLTPDVPPVAGQAQRGDEPFSWASAIGLLAVLSAVGARSARQRLDHRWVHRRVSVVATPAPVASPTITATGSNSALPVVRIEPHDDPGIQVLERSD